MVAEIYYADPNQDGEKHPGKTLHKVTPRVLEYVLAEYVANTEMLERKSREA